MAVVRTGVHGPLGATHLANKQQVHALNVHPLPTPITRSTLSLQSARVRSSIFGTAVAFGRPCLNRLETFGPIAIALIADMLAINRRKLSIRPENDLRRNSGVSSGPCVEGETVRFRSNVISDYVRRLGAL